MFIKKNSKAYIFILTILILGLSAAGTIAYLSADSGRSTNTFVSVPTLIDVPDDPDDPNDPKYGNIFDISETPVKENDNGSYSFDTERAPVKENEYQVYPGVDLPKDPAVHIKGLTAAKSVLFLEIVDNTPETLHCTVNSSNWSVVPDITGTNGGTVYVYKNGQIMDDEYEKNHPEIGNIGILEGNRVTVDNLKESNDLLFKNHKLDFKVYGFLCQANATDNKGSALSYNVKPAEIIVGCGFAEYSA